MNYKPLEKNTGSVDTA